MASLASELQRLHGDDFISNWTKLVQEPDELTALLSQLPTPQSNGWELIDRIAEEMASSEEAIGEVLLGNSGRILFKGGAELLRRRLLTDTLHYCLPTLWADVFRIYQGLCYAYRPGTLNNPLDEPLTREYELDDPPAGRLGVGSLGGVVVFRVRAQLSRLRLCPACVYFNEFPRDLHPSYLILADVFSAVHDGCGGSLGVAGSTYVIRNICSKITSMYPGQYSKRYAAYLPSHTETA